MNNLDHDSWIDIFLMIRKSAMLKTNVATLARYVETVKEFDGQYGIILVSPFPLYKDNDKYNIQVYYFEERIFDKKETLEICFADYDFRNNITLYESSVTANENLHSLDFGFVCSQKGFRKITEKNGTSITICGSEYAIVSIDDETDIQLVSYDNLCSEYKFELIFENGDQTVNFPTDCEIKTDDTTLVSISNNSAIFTDGHKYQIEICNYLVKITCF